MFSRNITTVFEKIEELENVVGFLECFLEVYLVDRGNDVFSVKNSKLFSVEKLVSIANGIKSDMGANLPIHLGEVGEEYSTISLKFSVSDDELLMVGICRREDYISKGNFMYIAIFKLIAMYIKSIFEFISTISKMNEKVSDYERAINFYDATFTTINKDMLLAYILDEIIVEMNAEVGGIVIVDNELRKIADFYLGVEHDLISVIIEEVKNNYSITKSKVFLEGDFLLKIERRFGRKISSVLFYPLLLDNEVLGFVVLINKKLGLNYAMFSDEDVRLLDSITRPAKVTIKNYIMFKELFFLNQFNTKILSSIDKLVLITGLDGSINYINKSNLKNLANVITESVNSTQVGDVKNMEVENDGKVYEVNVSTMYDELGKPEGLLWVIEDVTYKKELLNNYIVSEKLNMMSEIVSGVAHEIRNPLTSIVGFIELLKVRKNDPDFIEKFVSIASLETGRIINLLNSFMKFTKPINYEMTEVDLSKVISSTLDILHYQIVKKNITVINNVLSPVLVVGNYDLLLQVFTNLILNSIQAINHNDGRIEIEYISLYKGKNFEGVCIKDNGVGISHSIRNKIFDPFFTTKSEGTGLGLSICQKIISDHKGFISFESKEGKGTVFSVFLPSLLSKV